MDPKACECGRPQSQCVKGDLDRCPIDDEPDDSIECPECLGTTVTMEGLDCEECDGMGRVSL